MRLAARWSSDRGTATNAEATRRVSPGTTAERPSTLGEMPSLPVGVERDYPLARLTTIRTGGQAELFARAQTVEELERLLAWAHTEGHEVGVVGSGSNL